MGSYLQHIKKEINDSEFNIVKLLDDTSLEALNSIFGTHYTRQSVNKITVKRVDKGFNFFNRLMRVKPGFDKED